MSLSSAAAAGGNPSAAVAAAATAAAAATTRRAEEGERGRGRHSSGASRGGSSAGSGAAARSAGAAEVASLCSATTPACSCLERRGQPAGAPSSHTVRLPSRRGTAARNAAPRPGAESHAVKAPSSTRLVQSSCRPAHASPPPRAMSAADASATDGRRAITAATSALSLSPSGLAAPESA
eukprot:scaffold124498_cov60-Phaeocystis_antarctica.AAC.3